MLNDSRIHSFHKHALYVYHEHGNGSDAVQRWCVESNVNGRRGQVWIASQDLGEAWTAQRRKGLPKVPWEKVFEWGAEGFKME